MAQYPCHGRHNLIACCPSVLNAVTEARTHQDGRLSVSEVQPILYTRASLHGTYESKKKDGLCRYANPGRTKGHLRRLWQVSL